MENKVDALMNTMEIFSKEIKVWFEVVKLSYNTFKTMKVVEK
jgi:hypothetical protein